MVVFACCFVVARDLLCVCLCVLVGWFLRSSECFMYIALQFLGLGGSVSVLGGLTACFYWLISCCYAVAIVFNW